MKKFLPKKNFTRTLLVGLVFLFLGVIQSYAQFIDGNLNPATEYDNGVTQTYITDNGSTCQVDQVWASFDVQSSKVYLLFSVGNGGSALFRLYFDTDNDPLTGLQEDVVGKTTVYTYGADHAIEVNSNDASGYVFYEYSLDGQTRTTLTSSGIIGASGTNIIDGSNTMEFEIPFDAINYDPCSNLSTFINVGSYASVSGNNINSTWCSAVLLDFTIGAGGEIDGPQTICAGDDVQQLNLIGHQGTIVGWQANTGTGWPASDTDIIAGTEGSTTYQPSGLNETTEYRAVVQIATGLCSGDTYVYAVPAEITVKPTPTASVSATPTTVCLSGDKPVVTFTGDNATAPYTFTYKLNNGAEQTIISNGNTATIEVPTDAVEDFTYELVSVSSANGCTSGAIIGESVTVSITDLPNCNITGDLSICPSSAGNIYSGTDEEGMTYNWSISGDASINGLTTGKTVLVDADAICGGSFTLELTTTKNGCSSTCSIEVVVEDTTAPVWTLAPSDKTVECDGTNDPSGEFAAWLTSFSGSDVCGTATVTNNSIGLSDDCGATGAETVTFTLTDECGNFITKEATFTIEDTTDPVWTLAPSDKTVECDGTNDPNGEFAAWLTSFSGSDVCGTATVTNNSIGLSDDCGATGAETVTFTLTDECGNFITKEATFTIEDTTDPVWTLAPSDKTVECDGTNDPSGEFAAWLTSFSGSDVCGTATVTNNSIGLSDDCGATGAETVTFTLTDECGNFITKEATFTIEDTTDPVWTLAPSDKTVECDGTNDPSGEFAAWLTSFSGSDVCGTATVTNNSIGLSDDCGATGAETVTFTLTDECGNFITKEATFTIEDTTDPVWTLAPSDKTVECDGTNDPSGEFAAWLTSFSGSDVCGTATVTNNSIGLSDDCGATGAETVTFTLTDECGNFITKEATFTIEDTTDPVWTVAPSDKTVECDGTNDPSGEFAAWLTSFSGSDVCGTATVTNNSIGLSDDCGATGAETVTFTLTDECGNFITKEATFTIEDTTDPVWTVAPSDKTVECDGTNDPNGEFAAWLTSFSGSDVCGTATVTNNSIGLSDDCGATGAETVTFTLTDECGNFITKEATFTIEDTTDPVWTLAPSDKTVECDGTNDPSGEFAAWLTSFSGSDVCGTATVTNNSIGLSDDCGATGAETVTFTLTDECGNFITKEATFTIKDTTDPVWTLAPSDKTVECDGTNDPNGEFAAWLTSFSGSDVCGTATVTNNSIGLSDDCGATGAETVTFTLTDECGNFITKEATFTIEDTTDPVWTLAPSDKTVECDGTNDPSGEFAAWLTSFSGSDVCGTATVTNNSIGLSDDCGATGAETVTFTLTDECGNFITKEATFTIEDTTDPVWTVAPSDKTVECDGTNDPNGEFAAWLTSFSGSDVCGTATVTNNSIGLSDDCGATGAETVTFTLTDECGNFITKEATFTIEDTTDPVWTLAPSDKTVECDGTNDPSGEFAAWLTSFSGSDVCGTATVTNNSIGLSDDCGATGAETVTFTLTDECGNFITKEATFTIKDTTDPVWTVAPSDKTVECDGTNDPSGEFAAWLTSFSGSDVCGTATVTNNSIGLSDDCGATGAETVTFTLTDECGNFITKDATFTIEDTTDPVWTVAPSDKTVECDGTNDPSGEFAAWLTSFSGSDVCGTATVTNNSIGLSDDCGATGAETVTFTLTDECGNFITKDATFTIEDTTDPVWTVAPSDKTVECDGTNDPSGEFAAWLTSFSGSDVCGTATVTNNSIGLSDDCGATGAETVTFTLTDECGNFITKEATFTIEDTTDPVWTVAPSDKTVECDGTNDPSGEFAAWLTSFSGSDVCGTATVTNNSIGLSDDCGATGAETVTFTLTDECGNFITKEATFTIEDTTDPVWTLAPSDKTVECDGTNDPSGEFAAWLTSFSGSDVCGTATVTNNSIGLSDDCGATGAETVTFTLTDECGNFITKDATFTIEDTTDPVWTLAPSDKTVECDGTNDPSGEFAAWLTSFSGSDVCGTATVTNNSIGLSDDCGATGAETVTFTLTDECGNFITKDATFTIEDTTDPVWTLAPSDKTVECDGTNDPSGEFAAWLTSFSGSDVCGTATVTNNSIGLSDDCGATGAETVTFTLTDECGNFITKEATFTIKDTTDPVWTLAPSDKTVECDGTNDPSGEFAAWLTSFSGSDVCGTATVTNNSIGLSDDCGATGAETVTFTLTDECGNFITKEATFTIKDTTDPVWTLAPSDKTVECDGTNDPSGEFAAWLTSFSGSDVCGTATVTNNSIGLSDDCGATGAETVTFTLTDECGNFITKEATFTIKDTTDPVWTLAPSDKTVECDGTNDPSGEFAAWLTSFSGSDVCGTATVTNNSIGLSDDCGATGAETVTFTLTDECGNFITKEATFTIEDTTDPVWTVAPSDKTVECDGTNDPSGEFAAWLTSFSGSDVCGTATVTNNSIGLSDDCGATGAETVTFTLTDECGNFITKDATFTIEDTTDPVWTVAPSDKTVECDGTNDPSGEFAAWLTSFSGSDVCGTATVTNNSIGLSDDCGATGAETVTFTLTDECGNFITKDATFTIEDTTDPVWTVAPSDKTVECDGTNDPSGEFAAWLTSFSGSDVCGTATVTNNSIGLSDDCGATGAETVTFTLTDECGNFITKEATFTIEDTTDPVWTVAPSDKTVECDGTNDPSGEFAAWLTSFSGSDVCGTATVTNNSIGLSDDCGATGAETVTFTLTDECGNFITKEATFTIEDTTDPVWTLAPSDKTVECDGTNDPSGEFAAWLTSFSGSDVCGTATVTNNSIGLSDDCGATGAETVTFTLTDECGNFITKDATFTIEDTTDPVWTLAPSDKTVECDGTNDPSGEFAAWLTSFSGSDVCGTATVTNNSIGLSDDCGATGAETVTFTLTDECGNFITKEATFTIKDTTDPVWTLAPSDKTVECDGTNDPSGEFAAWLTSFSGSDVCGTATVTNNSIGLSDDCGATGAETVTFTLTDECGNFITKEATFTIKDTTDPVWTLAPSDKTVECDGTNDPSGEFAAWLTSFSGSDVCGTATVTNNSIGLSDDCGATGAETVTFTLTDECGNFITKEATFTIKDTTDPVWTLAPSDKTVECDGTNDPSGEFAAWLTSFSGSDVCGTATVTNNSIGLSDDCGATGAETVTFTLTDECGNFITKEATFTIEDTTDPVWTLAPSDKTVECDGTNDPNGEFAAWLTSFSGSDVCGTATVTNNSIGLSDDCGATGAETVTFTLTDECGNFITKEATFTIEDTTDPTIDNTNLTNIDIECGIDPASKLSYWLANHAGATATDNCGDVKWSNNYGENKNIQCEGGAITVIFTATDACGNASTTSASYSIQDNTTPTFNETLPTAEITAECDAVVEAVVLTASDNCDTDIPVVFTETRTDGDCANNYTLTRTWTATDDCGNETSFTQKVIVSDNTAPTFNETLPTTEITAECDAVVEAVVLTASDNCDSDVPVVFTETKTDGDCANNYTLIRTWTATDDCGNETSFTQKVIVSDNTAPEVTCNDITVQLDANGSTTITVDDINGGTTDACSDIDTMFISQATFNCDNVGENQVTLTAIDECGNEATCTATVTVKEGDADCGLQPFKANNDILSLVYCPDETVSGDLDLFANDEGFTSENVNFTILTDLPEGVSVTDGNLLYANENPTEAVITFTYSVCHTVNTENCSTAEVTIQLLVDTDCDGVPDIDDLDDDDDGILDIIEEENALDQTSLDSDGDGIVDRLDIDADNDGIVDNVEWQSTIAEGGEYDYIFPLGTDSNGDGWDDAYDPASNGITYEPWDMDLDGTPDYLDTNTDNEGEDDNVEGWDKFPNDSIADVSYIGSDTDKDGLDDAYDTYNTTTEEWAPGQNAIGSDAYLQDTDDDAVRDWRDAVDDRTPPEQFACGDPVIPNAFSPNQDGYNDYFKVMIYCTGTQGGNEERVLGDDFTDARIEIFNRWGNLVYEQERYGNEDYWGDVDAWWNGRSTHNMQVGSDQLPTATYYYILYFNDGSREPITGFVFLNN